MNIKYLWAKLCKKIRASAIIGSIVHKTSKVEAGSHIVNSTFDRHSYCGYDCKIYNTEVGAFCSIADYVVIGSGQHAIEWVSTSPVFRAGRDSVKTKYAEFELEDGKKTVIGPDVWIGERALVKQGVTIGAGSIIGMGSVVTKDIAPYSIVGGVPAKLIRMRFSDDIINKLMDIKWWEFDDEKIKMYAQYFNDPEELIKRVKL